jgi:hypothetical protein
MWLKIGISQTLSLKVPHMKLQENLPNDLGPDILSQTDEQV